MNSRRQGFTLIEMMIVAVLGAVIMGAVYQTLTVEYRSNRQINAVVTTQQTLRTAMQFLQSELREVGATSGDITYAASDAIRFRALRKVGFVCSVPSAGVIEVYRVGAPFDNSDSVFVYASGPDSTTTTDDTYYIGQVISTPSAAAGCAGLTAAPWPDMAVQARRMNLSAAVNTNNLLVGDPIRSFEVVTYGLTYINQKWVLGRKVGSGAMVALIGPLAPPTQKGLVFTYYDTLNALIPTASLAASLRMIGRVNIKLTGQSRSNAGTFYTDTLVSDVFLRGN